MGTASFAQTSFLGGEWSKQMQGRFDREDYRTGMNLCLNIVPIEEGAAPRRSGTRLGGSTRYGNFGVLREYSVNQSQPYVLELTSHALRVWRSNAGLVVEGTPITISAISQTNPAVFTSAGHGLSSFDHVIFTRDTVTGSYAGISQLFGRQFYVRVIDASTFTVQDVLTDAQVDGSTITLGNVMNLAAHKIFKADTSYETTDLQQVRIVQDGANALLLHPKYPPLMFELDIDTAGNFVSAPLVTLAFHDGPYLDIPTDGTTLTPGATTGLIHFTASAITSVNDGQGFLSTDVGRLFRVFSEPLAWAVGTAYVVGNLVKEADVYWKCVKANTGVQPSTDAGINWVISTTAAAWTWGTIQSIVSATVFVGQLVSSPTYPDNVAGGDLLYTNPITAWQLGAYSDTTGYPSCGAYYQGRVWLGGAIKNRFDACVSNQFAKSTTDAINFAPTGKDGTVADDSAISGTLNAKEIEDFLWMLPDEQGVLAGTQSGEWVIASSGAGEPITPTSIQTREITHYGSLNAQAIKVGRATIMIHRDTRKIYEYMANYFTQKFVADNLSLKAKHLTTSGIAEIAYMRELTPVIWARRNDGKLIGCTYKHDDPIKPLEFAAWHQHELGHGRDVVSIQGGPANGGQSDTLSLVTQDPDFLIYDYDGNHVGACYVEFLQTLWDESDSLLTAWFVDGGALPAGADRLNVGGQDIIRVYGLWYMIGQTVTAWGAGLDLGDYVVQPGAYIDIPFNQASSLFTDALLAGITAAGCTPLSAEING